MTIATEEARSALIEMARVWSRLADEQDTAPLPISIAKGNQQVIQQQQQQQQQQRQQPPAKKEEE
jgi:hypothetical protein